MRIQFSLSCQKGTVIPINYQSEISNWIFTVLSKAGAELSQHIQQMGFDVGTRTFRLFTFSPLAIYPYEMDQMRQEFKLLGQQVRVTVSFYLDPAYESHIIQLFRHTPLEMGIFEGKPAQFSVKHWQVQQRIPLKETLQFRALSPISITGVEEGKNARQFILPDSDTYDISFFNHAVRRFKAAMQYRSLAGLGLLDPAFPMSYRLLSQPKSRLIHLKPNADGLTQLRGFLYEFEVSMPKPLLEFCYYAGFGEYPYLGFGCVEIKTS
ncbi:MAG: hypothetical protein NZM43_12830 [Saprospiraceae bacterium]|nr:hypothetical protein [Saprospiraceae bacterium]MDW8485198.1 CRISPR-associated endoribonuclease Cas6 [Saprospiraceae bacterium]